MEDGDSQGLTGPRVYDGRACAGARALIAEGLALRDATDHACAHGVAGLRRNVEIRGLPRGHAGPGKDAERNPPDEYRIVVGTGREAQRERENEHDENQ